MHAFEAIFMSSESFPGALMSNKDLCIYMTKKGKQILKYLKILKLSLMRLFPCELRSAGYA